MSRLWNERVRVGLTPQTVVAMRHSIFPIRRVLATVSIPVPPAGTATIASTQMLAALNEALHAVEARHRAVSVILADSLNCYALLDGNNALRNDADWEAYAADALRERFGSPHEGWSLSLGLASATRQLTGSIRQRVVGAVSTSLFTGITTAVSAASGKLISLKPMLAATLGAANKKIVGRRLQGSHWLLSLEEQYVLVALVEGPRVLHVSGHRVGRLEPSVIWKWLAYEKLASLAAEQPEAVSVRDVRNPLQPRGLTFDSCSQSELGRVTQEMGAWLDRLKVEAGPLPRLSQSPV